MNEAVYTKTLVFEDGLKNKFEKKWTITEFYRKV